MARFDIFIGVWNTCGEVLETDAGPGGALVATDTYRWLPGKHFIVHDVDARFDGNPTRSMEVMGFDTASRQYFARSFDDEGTAGVYEIELKGRRWRITGETQRFEGSFNADKDRLTGLWELKSRRGAWQPWIKLELVKAS
jgi:hypothetical protein